MVHAGQATLSEINEKKDAQLKSRQELLLNRNSQHQAQIDKFREQLPLVASLYEKQAIPEMPDQSEALNKNFEETQGYISLNDALTKKNESITKQLETQHSHEKSTLDNEVNNENNHLIQMFQTLAVKFMF